MMKRLLSLMASCVICLCLLPLYGLDAHADDNQYQGWDGDWRASKLIDNEYGESGLFSNDNRNNLNEKIRSYARDLEMNIIVYIGGSYRSDDDTEWFCRDTYTENFGEDTDGVFYYLDLSGKSPAYDYIATSGKAVLLYEKNIDDIFDHLDTYLPSSGQLIQEQDIYDAVNSFLSQLSYYSENKPSSFAYYHDKKTGKYFYYKDDEFIVSKSKPFMIWVYIFLVCAAIGALVGLITYFVTKSRYKFKSKTNPSIYLAGNDVNFTERSDTLIRSYVTKHKIETSSGGGGSRGGFSGGGHSSGGFGGGGHHR